MKMKRRLKPNDHFVDNRTLAAMETMERYCTAHPGSPSAERRPQLSFRGQLWIALVGPSVEEGIVGMGRTVEAALHSFDNQYRAGLCHPTTAVRRRLYDW